MSEVQVVSGSTEGRCTLSFTGAIQIDLATTRKWENGIRVSYEGGISILGIGGNSLEMERTGGRFVWRQKT